jgi:4-hydroxybenzoate polyprenyltransferase
MNVAPIHPFPPRQAPGPGGPLQTLKYLLLAMRPKQWTKNGVVFVAVVFAHRLGSPRDVLLALLAVAIFCLVSGVVYIVNDLVDLEKDRQHPHKRHRPLASGRLRPRTAVVGAVAIGLGSLAVSVAVSPSPLFVLAVVAYVALNLGYSFYLKNIVLLDLFGIAGGFLLRAAGGAFIINVPISPWLYLCTLLGALFIGLGKRRHELIVLEGTAASHRKILGEYTTEFLEELITIVSSATLVSYALYTYSSYPDTHAMMATIPFAVYGIFRYLFLVHLRNEGGAPEEILLRDRPLLIDIALWIATAGVILYALNLK